jgi:hypothetical protein
LITDFEDLQLVEVNNNIMTKPQKYICLRQNIVKMSLIPEFFTQIAPSAICGQFPQLTGCACADWCRVGFAHL